MILLAFPNGILRSAAHADHKPAAVDKVVNRDRQIQGRQAVCAQSHGNEKGIRQYVTGKPYHPHYIQRCVFCKFTETTGCFHNNSPASFIFYAVKGFEEWEVFYKSKLLKKLQELYLPGTQTDRPAFCIMQACYKILPTQQIFSVFY